MEHTVAKGVSVIPQLSPGKYLLFTGHVRLCVEKSTQDAKSVAAFGVEVKYNR
jgi:hypothetical protein